MTDSELVAGADHRLVEKTISQQRKLRVSHETIDRSLFIQARRVLKKQLMQHLLLKHQICRSVDARAGGHFQGQIVNAVSIREKPAEVEDRARPTIFTWKHSFESEPAAAAG